MATYHVLITDYEYENLDNERAILNEIDAELHPFQTKNEDDIISAAQNCDALIFQYSKISDKIISNLNRCKIIAKYATGTDNIDIKAATEKGICFANVADYCTDEVSTHAMAMLLNLNRKIKVYNGGITNGNWSYKLGNPLNSLKESIVGVIGLGRISSSFIKKLSLFCDQIWVCSNFADEEKIRKMGAKKKSFEEIIRHADYISIHSPLTDSTGNLFNKDVFKAMKKTSSIVNLSRGGLVNEDDLVWALEQKEISGAALDVMSKEPPDRSNPLLHMENVVITPHAGWYSARSQKELQTTVAMEVKRVLTGFFPKNLVNTELLNTLPLKAFKEE